MDQDRTTYAQTFVANRVAKIQELTVGGTWGHVPSEENPADLLSRGATIEDLKTNDLWWNGPSWIRERESQPRCMQEPETNLPEMKIVTLTTNYPFAATLLRRYSSFNKLCRIIAYCYRFVSKSVTPRDKTLSTEKVTFRPFDVGELIRTKTTVLKWVQEEEFRQELKCLTNNQDLGGAC